VFRALVADAVTPLEGVPIVTPRDRPRTRKATPARNSVNADAPQGKLTNIVDIITPGAEAPGPPSTPDGVFVGLPAALGAPPAELGAVGPVVAKARAVVRVVKRHAIPGRAEPCHRATAAGPVLRTSSARLAGGRTRSPIKRC